MAKIIQNLWFEADMKSAIRFYVSLIPGSAMHWIQALAGSNQSRKF